MANQWWGYLGSEPVETHFISPSLTIHILQGGLIKDDQAKNLPHSQRLLEEVTGEKIPGAIMKRINHYLDTRKGDARSERIRRAAEAAAAAEREAIEIEEMEEHRKAKRAKNKDYEEEDTFEEEDEEELDDFEEELVAPSPAKVSKAKKK